MFIKEEVMRRKAVQVAAGLLGISLWMTACSPAGTPSQDPLPSVESTPGLNGVPSSDSDPTPVSSSGAANGQDGDKSPAAENSPTPLSPPQGTKARTVPGKEQLIAFPGMLKSISLSLEELVKILGRPSELTEDTAAGMEFYRFDEGLSFEYDRVNGKLSSVYLKDKFYSLYSGSWLEADLDNDGTDEFIVAYEDEGYDGHVAVISMEGKLLDNRPADYFGGYSNLTIFEIVAEGKKETVISLESNSERKNALYSYTDGILSTIVPVSAVDTDAFSLMLDKNQAVVVNNPLGILYMCPLPSALISPDFLPGAGITEYRVTQSFIPQKEEDGLHLAISHRIQLKIMNEFIDGAGIPGAYWDIASFEEDYLYKGNGLWHLNGNEGEPKYADSDVAREAALINSGALKQKDFGISGLYLRDTAEALTTLEGFSAAAYTQSQLLQGLLYKKDGLTLGITNGRCSYLSLEPGSRLETERSLKIGDDRNKAKELYGLPQLGFFSDREWIYYGLSSYSDGADANISLNTLHIEFQGAIVSKIWLSAYEPVY